MHSVAQAQEESKRFFSRYIFNVPFFYFVWKKESLKRAFEGLKKNGKRDIMFAGDNAADAIYKKQERL